MSKDTPTPILVDTAVLSDAVSDILKTLGADRSKKSLCLNRLAARIAGPKHNWGFLTGQASPIVAQGVDETYTVSDRDLDPSAEAILPLVEEAARTVLEELRHLPKESLPGVATTVAMIYMSQFPQAGAIFTTANEIANDLRYNRTELLSSVEAIELNAIENNRRLATALAELRLRAAVSEKLADVILEGCRLALLARGSIAKERLEAAATHLANLYVSQMDLSEAAPTSAKELRNRLLTDNTVSISIVEYLFMPVPNLSFKLEDIAPSPSLAAWNKVTEISRQTKAGDEDPS